MNFYFNFSLKRNILIENLASSLVNDNSNLDNLKKISLERMTEIGSETQPLQFSV